MFHHHATILLISLLLLANGACNPSATVSWPLIQDTRLLQANKIGSIDASSLIKTDVSYRLTTTSFVAQEGYLTVTRTGAGLMQIRRPRYASEETHWHFTPAANGLYHLLLTDQSNGWAYNHELVAVKPTDDATQLWQITPLANGTYRLTNQALGPGQSLATIGEGMPYPGWGEVVFAETASVGSQQWILEEAPMQLVAVESLGEEPPIRGIASDDEDDEPPARGVVDDEEEPPARGAVTAADETLAETIFSFDEFGLWQRGEQPYGDFIQSQEQVVAGSSGKLHYDFTLANQADDYVIFLQQASINDSPSVIKAQVYGDGSGHFLSVWILDAAGETWSIALGQVTGQGWQELRGAIDPNAGWPTGTISGPQNGQIDYPIQLAGLVLDRVDVNAPAVGQLFLDDLTFTVAADPPTAATTTTMEEVDDVGEDVGEDDSTDASADEVATETAADVAAEQPIAAAAEVTEATDANPQSTEAEVVADHQVVSSHSYELIPLEDGRDPRPAAEHADLNLDLRELQSLDAALNFIETNGATDSHAPNFLGVLEPNFVATYTAHDWDWGCNCKGGLIEYPWGRVAAVEFATTPGDAIYILRRLHAVYQGKFFAVLLYATEDSLTYVYTREGNIANGYAIHYKGLVTDPELLRLYRESSGDMLPGLTLDTPVGHAKESLIVSIRDRGAFMDPRNHENWWLDRGLPRPPGR